MNVCFHWHWFQFHLDRIGRCPPGTRKHPRTHRTKNRQQEKNAEIGIFAPCNSPKVQLMCLKKSWIERLCFIQILSTHKCCMEPGNHLIDVLGKQRESTWEFPTFRSCCEGCNPDLRVWKLYFSWNFGVQRHHLEEATSRGILHASWWMKYGHLVGGFNPILQK